MSDKTEDDNIREDFLNWMTDVRFGRGWASSNFSPKSMEESFKAGVSSQQEKIEELEEVITDLSFTIASLKREREEKNKEIESMRCCANCHNYKTIPAGYSLKEYCSIIEHEPEKYDIAKYDKNCLNWKPRS